MIENVIDFAGFRAKLRRGGPPAGDKACAHLHVIVDEAGGTIECEDCKRSLSAFKVLVMLVNRWHDIAEEVRHLKARAAAVRNLVRTYKPRMRAIKEIEKLWWRDRMAPCCPHCGRGLLPMDFANGSPSSVGQEYELAQRKRGRPSLDRH